ncbi:MAG: efflux RND transporter periplasmic adaptor subunit [Verrucomicrobiales bacterium]
MIRAIPSNPFRLLPAVAACALFASCASENEFVPPPPPEVDVQAPLVQPLTVYQEYAGRTEPFKRYEVRTRVTGFIEEKHFEDGRFVKEGDKLFGIERVQFEAAVTKAEGDRDKAIAELGLAESNYEKRASASVSGAISKIDVEAALAEKDVAAANVTIMEAALKDAIEDLGYCDIDSAIDGRVSRPLVDKGNLVNGQEATLLATVVQDDPIFVTVEISQREIIRYLDQRPGAEKPEIDKDAKGKELKLLKADGSPYALSGSFHSIDNELNSETGTIEVTSEFANPDGELAAGLSVRLRVPEKLESAVLIPAAAVQRDLLGTYVFVLGEDQTAKRQTVVVSRFSRGEFALIDDGLGAEDRVLVSNLQRIRAGAKINPTEIDPPVLEETDEAPTPPAPEEVPESSSASVPDQNTRGGGVRA